MRNIMNMLGIFVVLSILVSFVGCTSSVQEDETAQDSNGVTGNAY